MFYDFPTKSFTEFLTSIANTFGMFNEFVIAYYPVDFELFNVSW